MAITPSTDLKLLKVNINIDERNQLTFDDTTTQYNYFNSLPKLEVDNFTYQRADGVIRYPAHIDTIINFNYCMYQNENYTNKWFYAFITGMRYINDNMTEISIKTDVWQTWGFDIEVGQCYVEREHVDDDTIGLHTYPEGLETGEYIIKESYDIGLPIEINANMRGYYTIIACTIDPLTNDPYQYAEEYGGVENGCGYFVLKDSSSIEDFLTRLARLGKIDAVTGAFVVPTSLFYHIPSNNTFPEGYWDQYNFSYTEGGVTYNCLVQYKKLDSTYFGRTYSDYYGNTKSFLMNSPAFYPAIQLVGYTPKNNKLLTHPYSFIELTNNCGGSVIYRYEDFDYGLNAGVGQCNFEIVGTLCPGCSITCIPKWYKNKAKNFEEALTHGKLPIAAYQNDMYTNWLTQNSLSLKIGAAQNFVNSIGSIVTGNPMGAINGLFGIAQTQAEVEKHKMIPPQAEGNVNNGDITFAYQMLNYSFHLKCIKKEYAEKIDNFFSMFGYKVNITKVPNLYSRPNWNYIKTIDANIEGFIPQTDLQEIKDMFNNGITLWHNPSTFLDYSQDNSIPLTP